MILREMNPWYLLAFQFLQLSVVHLKLYKALLIYVKLLISKTFFENIFAQVRNILAQVLPTNTQSYSRVIHYKHHYLCCFCCQCLKKRDKKKTKLRNIPKAENKSLQWGKMTTKRYVTPITKRKLKKLTSND